MTFLPDAHVPTTWENTKERRLIDLQRLPETLQNVCFFVGISSTLSLSLCLSLNVFFSRPALLGIPFIL